MSDGGDDMLPVLLILGAAGGLAYWFWRQSQAAASLPSPQPTPSLPPPGAGSEPQMYYPAPSPPQYAPPYYPPAYTGGAQAVRSVSAAGQQNIKNREGLRLTPYSDGPGRSIGYGHFIQPGEVFNGPITQARANQLFASDIAHVEHIINSQVKVPLSQNRYDALADLVFNLGHIPPQLLAQLNAGNYAGATPYFAASAGALPGVVTRREYDASLWSTG